MNIQSVIVHSLQKDRYQTSATVQLRDSELPVEPKVSRLITRIADLYGKRSGRAYGNFGPTHFSAPLKGYLDDATLFVSFTKTAMNTLSDEIVKAQLATGGYVLFAMFEQFNQRQFMVVILKDTEGVSFDNKLDVLDVNHLELDNLHLAVSIDVTRWQLGNAQKYVSFVKGRHNTVVTEYFKRFIGIQEFSDSAKDTAGLVAIVRSFAHEKELGAVQEEELKSRVYSYCTDRLEHNAPVYLNELSRYLDEANPEAFLEHVNESGEQINSEILLDKRGLRKFVKYSGRNNEMSISFDANLLGERVQYLTENDTLIIKGIPESLIQQLTTGLEG